jgi:hypothetical protein
MRVCVYLDRGRTFRWHYWLLAALTGAGYDVHVRFSRKKLTLPKSVGTLFAMERLSFNSGESNSAIDHVDPSLLPPSSGTEQFDVVIRLAADDASLPATRRTLTPCFNSVPTVFGAIAALSSDEPLKIEVYDSSRSVPISAYPAVADHDILLRGLDNLLSCAVGLIIKTLTTSADSSVPAGGCVVNGASSIVGAAYAHAIKSVTRKIGRYLQILAEGHRTWNIAWRYDSVSLLDRGSATFRVLPNKKGHYYGDPFPLRRNGTDFIFVEDFDYATGYACISVATVGQQVTMPRAVLDTGYHLSYPFVFEYQDQIWMIPESGDIGDIRLYRAVKFPDEWECFGTLLHNVQGYDATVLHVDQRFWLFICERMWNSTGWDAFSLFHSDRLLDAKWVPHGGGNPVVFDARYSRSAGAIFSHQGRLIRPVQDCSRFYGGAVNLCEIDRLSPDEFRQHVIGTIQCAPAPDAPPYRGCHTYNYRDGLEVIDIFDRNIGDEVIAFYRPIEQRQPVSRFVQGIGPTTPSDIIELTRTSNARGA